MVLTFRILFFMLICAVLLAPPVILSCALNLRPTPEEEQREEMFRTERLAEVAAQVWKGEMHGPEVAQLVNELLSLQAGQVRDESWSRQAGDVIEAAHERRQLAAGQWLQYLSQSVDVQLDVPTMADNAGVVRARYRMTARLGSRTKVRVTYLDPQYELDGLRIVTPSSTVTRKFEAFESYFAAGPWQNLVLHRGPDSSLKPGVHSLSADFRLQVFDDSATAATDERWAVTTREPTKQFQVVKPQPAMAAPTFSAEDRAAVTNAVTLESIDAARSRRASLNVTFRRTATPRPVVFDVFLRDGDAEWEMARGVKTEPPGITCCAEVPGFDARRVDVVLRPSAEWRDVAFDPARAAANEIVFHDLPVLRFNTFR